MIQIWELDENKLFTGKSYFVEEVLENMTTIPLLVGYIKPKFNGVEWVEGATDEEIAEYKANKIDICLEPTELQVLQEQVTKLIINQL